MNLVDRVIELEKENFLYEETFKRIREIVSKKKEGECSYCESPNKSEQFCNECKQNEILDEINRTEKTIKDNRERIK